MPATSSNSRSSGTPRVKFGICSPKRMPASLPTVGVVRVSVVGTSGSGKTTFGRALAARLDVPFVELDAINWQPGWTPMPEDEFRRRVADVVTADRWVIDGNYAAVRDLVLARATTVAWLDYSRARIMTQVIRRSVSRAITRRELWNGNREDPRGWVDPG